MNWSLIIVFCLAVSLRVHADIHQIHIVIEESEAQTKNEDNYYLSALDFLLQHSKPEYGEYEIVICREYLSQERQLRFLRMPKDELPNECSIDLLWSSDEKGREKGVKKLTIPVDLGLNGIKILVTTKGKLDLFSDAKTPRSFAKLLACLGTQWPDTRIMEQAGIPVFGAPSLDVMYALLKRGRCDYIPAAVHEVRGEIEHFNNGELVLVKSLVFRYNLPTYFYIRPNDTLLARRLSAAFEETFQNGSFFEFVRNHKATKDAFNIRLDEEITIIDIENSELDDLSEQSSLGLKQISGLLFENVNH